MSGPVEAMGTAIRLARARRKWSQERLGRAADLDRSYLGQIERGQRDLRVSTLDRIAAALGLSLTQLVQEAVEEQAQMRQVDHEDEPVLQRQIRLARLPTKGQR